MVFLRGRKWANEHWRPCVVSPDAVKDGTCSFFVQKTIRSRREESEHRVCEIVVPPCFFFCQFCIAVGESNVTL